MSGSDFFIQNRPDPFRTHVPRSSPSRWGSCILVLPDATTSSDRRLTMAQINERCERLQKHNMLDKQETYGKLPWNVRYRIYRRSIGHKVQSVVKDDLEKLFVITEFPPSTATEDSDTVNYYFTGGDPHALIASSDLEVLLQYTNGFVKRLEYEVKGSSFFLDLTRLFHKPILDKRVEAQVFCQLSFGRSFQATKMQSIIVQIEVGLKYKFIGEHFDTVHFHQLPPSLRSEPIPKIPLQDFDMQPLLERVVHTLFPEFSLSGSLKAKTLAIPRSSLQYISVQEQMDQQEKSASERKSFVNEGDNSKIQDAKTAPEKVSYFKAEFFSYEKPGMPLDPEQEKAKQHLGLLFLLSG
eukprot:g3118.t1